MILAIDFDDTIHDTRNVWDGYKLGRPVEGAQSAMRKLREEGHTLIIHTVWGAQKKAIADWLFYFNIPYDDITSQKPAADRYIDNKGLRFRDWRQTLEELKDD